MQLHGNNTDERRLGRRYPVNLEVRYRLKGKRARGPFGLGRTVDLSSQGALFETTDILPARGEIELALKWPYRIDGGCCLQLILHGHIVRLEPGKVAMRSTSYVFRTLARATFDKTER